MSEEQAVAAARADEAEATEGVRVTDRRRINLDGVTEQTENNTGGTPPRKPKYVEELEERARAAEQKLIDVQARFEQLRADLRRETDETRQRLNRTADERARREKAAFISSLLPVLDNLRRAVEAAESGGTLDSLLGGLRGTISGFEGALAAAGAEPIQSVGAPFDPELHEAVEMVEVEPERDGLVVGEHTRGYKMGDSLLRPARVQVGRAIR